MSMPGGKMNGTYLMRGDLYEDNLSEKWATGSVAAVYGAVGLVFGVLIGMGLSSLFGLSPVFRVLLITGMVLVIGGGVAWIAGRIAQRGTEDKRVAQFLAESGSGDGGPQRDAER